MAEPQDKITHAEIVEIFGSEMPIEAVSILNDESITPNEARERLRGIAASRAMAGDIEITDEAREAIAEALKPYGHSLKLISLIDGVSTYRVEVAGEVHEFEFTDDAYEWISDKKRELQAIDVYSALYPIIAKAAKAEAREAAAVICEKNQTAGTGVGAKREYWLFPNDEDGPHPGHAYAAAIRSMEV